MSRNRIGPVFSRDSESSDPEWFIDYANKLDKLAVQPVEKDRSMFDQISEIMGSKSKFSTVEDAVKDMRERTGLNKFLSVAAQTIESNVKTASDDDLEVSLPSDDEIPKLFNEHPHIEKYINKYISSRKGHTSIASLLSEISRLFKEVDSAHLDDKVLKNFISNKIIEERELNPNNENFDVEMLGAVDKGNEQEYEANNDAFSSLVPAKF